MKVAVFLLLVFAPVTRASQDCVVVVDWARTASSPGLGNVNSDESKEKIAAELGARGYATTWKIPESERQCEYDPQTGILIRCAPDQPSGDFSLHAEGDYTSSSEDCLLLARRRVIQTTLRVTIRALRDNLFSSATGEATVVERQGRCSTEPDREAYEKMLEEATTEALVRSIRTLPFCQQLTH